MQNIILYYIAGANCYICLLKIIKILMNDIKKKKDFTQRHIRRYFSLTSFYGKKIAFLLRN